MSDSRNISATIAEGPNAGRTAIVLAYLGGIEELNRLRRAARRRVKAVGFREIKAATHSEFMSDEFLNALTGAAALVAEGVFEQSDLRAANIAGLELESGTAH